MNNNSNLRKFILLWAGELISSIGGGLTSFGLGVYIFQQTGSAASKGNQTAGTGELFLCQQVADRSAERGLQQGGKH